mmetsp:Transcript_59693/g.99154  ORF Transcript_59693/g.99154 Transcript_59693/m.99154 type:complete len:81 (+) Transcript_59693:68-310(+)
MPKPQHQLAAIAIELMNNKYNWQVSAYIVINKSINQSGILEKVNFIIHNWLSPSSVRAISRDAIKWPKSNSKYVICNSVR